MCLVVVSSVDMDTQLAAHIQESVLNDLLAILVEEMAGGGSAKAPLLQATQARSVHHYQCCSPLRQAALHRHMFFLLSASRGNLACIESIDLSLTSLLLLFLMFGSRFP